ncbi:hypothetical protein BC937DRAFT_95458 [Endogone sp. FLAS-F59071]|nr:hypothetical protein BC937DRAFT_95458 [Endogone sp. FLAS-F59071]|eukprot:RUS20341.1 hypothetical protein BC937DRAFT_95458 [Endogone sp. FLAS-F59071]
MVAVLFLRANANPLVPTNVISFGTAPFNPVITNTLTEHANAAVAAAHPAGTGPPPPVVLNTTGIGFDGPPCNALGIATYQLNLPTVEIFNGVPTGIPAGIPPGGIDIDLYYVQDGVLSDD